MPRPQRRPKRPRHSGWSHWGAPVAFLAAATIAVVLVATALNGNRGDTTTSTSTARPAAAHTTTAARKRSPKKTTTTKAGSFYTVVAGDTFGTIAAKNGTTVAELERLNPGVSSTSLHVGQKIRVA